MRRIELYFEEHAQEKDRQQRRGPARGDEALVVGVYGPWGCGKTRWLGEIKAQVRPRTASGSLTVPVMFNAWQFEREPHLIIPLLKTAEAQVQARLEHLVANEDKPAEQRVLAGLKRAALMLGDAAVALAMGLSGGFSLGAKLGVSEAAKVDAGVKVNFDAKKAIEGYRELRERRSSGGPASPLAAYESFYFELRGLMKALTGHEPVPQSWVDLDEGREALERQEQRRKQLQAELELLRREVTDRRYGATTAERKT